MIVDFSQDNESVINFAHVFQPGEIDLNDETATVAGELEVAGRAHRIAETADIAGTIVGKLGVACHRCIEPFEVPIDIRFDDSFVTLDTYEQSKAEHEIGGADLNVSIFDGERIDLGEIVREQILLNVPTHLLCDENCAGLCENCGANKNAVACDCHKDEIDPRWNALRELKIQE